VDRAVVAFYDITERLRLERALVRQRAEAEMAASEAALRAEESRALRDIARALVSELEPERVLQLAVRHAMELIGARGSAVTTPLPDGASMRIAPAAGLLAVLEGSVYPWEGSVAARVAEVGRTLRFNDVDDIPATSPVLPVVRRMGVRNAAFVPLRAFGEFFGIISVVDREDGFSDEDVRVLEALADSAALAVRNARLYEGAQAASRAKSEFLAMMSHELRTPLNALEGYASLLEDGIYGPVNAQQAQALGRMRAARQHLVELIERVLDVARVEAGVKRLDVEEVDAAALARSVAEALRGAAEHKGLALRVEAEEVGKIRTDAAMVRQVLTNLLGNAFKFTETGTVVLRVAGDGERVRMEVSDTGPGIAAEHHERIFEPFYQVDPSTTRREGGTGLGLALSREFARLLGGDIAVHSTPGGGSTFVLTLPRTPASL
jgi:signal transduction histidine kinase